MNKHIYTELSSRKVSLLIGVIITVFSATLPAQSWKEEAWERINTFRKSDLTITLLSETGDPIENASVRVKLKKHEFTFGAVIRSDFYNASEHKAKYAELYYKYFTLGEFGIAMKPKSTDNNGFWEKRGEQALPLFEDNNIPMRGHTLVWEGYNFFPNEAKVIYDRTDLTDEEKAWQLVDRLDDHILHAIPKWENVKYWDVINEPCVNDHVNKLLPDYNTFVHWFNLAESVRDEHNLDFKLVLNENNVISGNAPWVEDRIPDFTAIIDEMLEQEAPIEMLGFQSRIQYGMLSPETMYERLLMFDKYNLPYQATEFEIRDFYKEGSPQNYAYTDDEVRQLTEETMTIYLSHPKVEAFIHWSFVDDINGERPWSLFKYDGTPYVTGEKWIELMEGEFTTDATLTTDAQGRCTIKAWKGDYDITATYGGTTKEGTIQLSSDTDIEWSMDVVTSLGNKDKLDPISIHLNTAQNSFTISASTEISGIVLYDLSGRIIRKFHQHDKEYSLDGFSKGIYIVLIETNNSFVTKKLLVL